MVVVVERLTPPVAVHAATEVTGGATEVELVGRLGGAVTVESGWISVVTVVVERLNLPVGV